MAGDYIIRPFEGIEDHVKGEDLQRLIWRGDAHVPSNLMITIQRHGGVTLGAFLPDGELIGFVLGFLSPTSAPGAWKALSHHSHIAAVRTDYQNAGLGEALKRAQREAVLAQGVNLMTWTYDPLEARNGNLNLHKLGCIVRKYIPNCYGAMRDSLNAGLPSDRFEPEWWLVEEDRARWSRERARAITRIDIAPDFQALKRHDHASALALRLRKREEFLQAFARGFVVIDFERTDAQTCYVLGQFDDAPAGH